MPPTSPHTPGLHHRKAARRREGAGRHAERLLGAGHPLVAVLYAYGATVESIAAVAGVQAGVVALWWIHMSYARALAIGAALVQAALGLRLAVLRAERRELCLELVIDGRERLPLAAIERECGSLGDTRRQARLATSLERLAEIESQPTRRERQRPIYTQRVLAGVGPELRDAGERLRAGRVDVRGVAMLDHLVTSGSSPLYGQQVCILRQELARARYLLG